MPWPARILLLVAACVAASEASGPWPNVPGAHPSLHPRGPYNLPPHFGGGPPRLPPDFYGPKFGPHRFPYRQPIHSHPVHRHRQACKTGFYWERRAGSCADINECLVVPEICGKHKACHNLHGTYDCRAHYRPPVPHHPQRHHHFGLQPIHHQPPPLQPVSPLASPTGIDLSGPGLSSVPLQPFKPTAIGGVGVPGGLDVFKPTSIFGHTGTGVFGSHGISGGIGHAALKPTTLIGGNKGSIKHHGSYFGAGGGSIGIGLGSSSKVPTNKLALPSSVLSPTKINFDPLKPSALLQPTGGINIGGIGGIGGGSGLTPSIAHPFPYLGPSDLPGYKPAPVTKNSFLPYNHYSHHHAVTTTKKMAEKAENEACCNIYPKAEFVDDDEDGILLDDESEARTLHSEAQCCAACAVSPLYLEPESDCEAGLTKLSRDDLFRGVCQEFCEDGEPREKVSSSIINKVRAAASGITDPGPFDVLKNDASEQDREDFCSSCQSCGFPCSADKDCEESGLNACVRGVCSRQIPCIGATFDSETGSCRLLGGTDSHVGENIASAVFDGRLPIEDFEIESDGDGMKRRKRSFPSHSSTSLTQSTHTLHQGYGTRGGIFSGGYSHGIFSSSSSKSSSLTSTASKKKEEPTRTVIQKRREDDCGFGGCCFYPGLILKHGPFLQTRQLEVRHMRECCAVCKATEGCTAVVFRPKADPKFQLQSFINVFGPFACLEHSCPGYCQLASARDPIETGNFLPDTDTPELQRGSLYTLGPHCPAPKGGRNVGDPEGWVPPGGNSVADVEALQFQDFGVEGAVENWDGPNADENWSANQTSTTTTTTVAPPVASGNGTGTGQIQPSTTGGNGTTTQEEPPIEEGSGQET